MTTLRPTDAKVVAVTPLAPPLKLRHGLFVQQVRHITPTGTWHQETLTGCRKMHLTEALTRRYNAVIKGTLFVDEKGKVFETV